MPEVVFSSRRRLIDTDGCGAFFPRWWRPVLESRLRRGGGCSGPVAGTCSRASAAANHRSVVRLSAPLYTSPVYDGAQTLSVPASRSQSLSADARSTVNETTHRLTALLLELVVSAGIAGGAAD